MYLKDELPVLERWICSGCGSLPCERCRYISKTNQAILSTLDGMTAFSEDMSTGRLLPTLPFSIRSRGVLGKCHMILAKHDVISSAWRDPVRPWVRGWLCETSSLSRYGGRTQFKVAQQGYARSRSARQWPRSKVNILVLFLLFS